MRAKKTLTSRIMRALNCKENLSTEQIHKHVNWGMNKRYQISRRRVSDLCGNLYRRNRLERPGFAVYSTVE